ncbi:MAG TPA: hypothetical protein VLL54_08275 [Pyrinomonadaceae bacterium]|nr:hypothetical protein [Pyrinomonadaceae bacterium]
MDKFSQHSLETRLEDELKVLSRLRERISELRFSLVYEETTTLCYAVDFSEIFSYLNQEDAEAVKGVGVSLDFQNVERNSLQHRLALTHLFNGFADTLYVLPSHMLELWTYVRSQVGKRAIDGPKAGELLEAAVRNLSPATKSLLESLGHEEQPERVSQELLEFVKSRDFGPLCVDVSNFVAWFKRGNALKKLLDEIINPRFDKLLTTHSVVLSELKEPSENEISKIVDVFSTFRSHRNPFATRVDARAFLFLRNLNQLLARANTRLILVTRDTHLLEVARRLADESWFGWAESRQCVRGIESIFLDLILRSSPSPQTKRLWINQSEEKLAKMSDSVERTLNQIRAGEPYPSQQLLNAGKRVLKDTIQLWDQHINVKLSLASNSVPWLGKSFRDMSDSDQTDRFVNLKDYKILKNLLDYFSTATYRDIAVEDVKAIWSGIETDCLRMGFLNVLGDEGAERISNILTQTLTPPFGASQVLLHSKRFIKMPSLRLISKSYQDTLGSLNRLDKGTFDRALNPIITEIVSGSDEPEDLLVMAFFLGLLEEWNQALEVIAACKKVVGNLAADVLPTKIIPSEVDYLSATIKQRLAQIKSDTTEAAQLYLEALKDIHQARESNPKDARYLVSEAAVTMMYHESTTLVCPWPLDSDMSSSEDGVLSPAAAKSQLHEALNLATAGNDRRLAAIILNNLAFSEVFAELPNFEAAEEHVSAMKKLIDEANSEQRRLLAGLMPHFEETSVMLLARRAKDNEDFPTLDQCRKDLIEIAQSSELSDYEKTSFRLHLRKLSQWLQKT